MRERTPGIETQSFTVSSPPGNIQQTNKQTLFLIKYYIITAIFCSYNQPLQFCIFSFHQAPITAGWTEAIWHEKFA